MIGRKRFSSVFLNNGGKLLSVKQADKYLSTRSWRGMREEKARRDSFRFRRDGLSVSTEVEKMVVDAERVLRKMEEVYGLTKKPFGGEEQISLSGGAVRGRWILDTPITKIYQTSESEYFLASGGKIESKALPGVILRITLEEIKGLNIRRPYHSMASNCQSLEQGFQHIIEMLELCASEGWSVLEFESQNLDMSNLPGVIVKMNWPYDELGHDWLAVIGEPRGRFILEDFRGIDKKWYKPHHTAGSPHSMGALRFDSSVGQERGEEGKVGR